MRGDITFTIRVKGGGEKVNGPKRIGNLLIFEKGELKMRIQ